MPIPVSEISTSTSLSRRSVRHVIVYRNLGLADERMAAVGPATDMADAIARDDAQTATFQPLSLAFDHPVTKKRLSFDSELPLDMQTVIEKWRSYSGNR